MTTGRKDRDDAARAEILARLVESREELRRILDPPAPPREPGDSAPGAHAGFPRSRTMQMLMTGRGLGTLGAAAAGLLVARPRLALKLLRLLPAGPIVTLLLPRILAALRNKKPSS